MKKITYIITILLLAQTICAEVIPTVYVRSSGFSGNLVIPKYAVNGSGVLNDLHSNFPPQTMWHTNTNTLPVSEAWIECDLGQLCSLSLLKFYNYNDKWSDIDNTGMGVQHFTIMLSDDGVNYVPFGGTRYAIKAPGIPEEPGVPRDNRCMTVYDMTGAVARYVKIDIIDNYQGVNQTGVGISELVFEGNYTALGQNVASDEITVTPTYASLANYDPQNVVNGNGFIAGGFGAHNWTDSSAGPNGWVGYINDGQAELTFTFANPKNLAAVRIWNFDSWFGMQGVHAPKDFELHISTDGATFTQALTGELDPYAYSTAYDYSKSFAMPAENVVAVKMVITSTHYGNSPSTGLNEVQFVQGTGPIIPLTIQSTTPDGHGHWFDDIDQTYRVYDRWEFDADDTMIDLSRHNSINFFIRPPAGHVIRVDESCSVSAFVSMYDTAWTSDPFTWLDVDGTSLLQGRDIPITTEDDFWTKIDGTRQIMMHYVSGESAGPWLFRSLVLRMDISSMKDPQAAYKFGNEIESFLVNDLTFSSMTESSTDTGIFTSLLPDVYYDLNGFADLADAWTCSGDDQCYTPIWDLFADDSIDMADLAVFCENWLLIQK